MHSLGDIEVDFIDNDLKSRGIVSEDLRDDLLDHICCIIENELTEEANFYEYYQCILPRFFKKELAEIQVETDNLLRFKNFYTMKKILKFSGITTVVFTLLGALFKSFHFPGTGMLILLGGFIFSFVFLPLLILIKFKDGDSKTEKFVFGFGFLVAIFMCTGLIFKVMHWPGATKLMLYSTIAFTFLYVPVYFITRIKRPELKFNTLVNSVLMIACGGIFYSLFDLSYSHEFSKNMPADHVVLHENSERIMASNERLLLLEGENSTARELHLISEQLNHQLENIASWIDNKQSTLELGNQLVQLDKQVEQYNAQVNQIQLEELHPIYMEIDKLNQIYPMLAMNAVARMQQQIALNENSYLTQLVAHK